MIPCDVAHFRKTLVTAWVGQRQACSSKTHRGAAAPALKRINICSAAPGLILRGCPLELPWPCLLPKAATGCSAGSTMQRHNQAFFLREPAIPPDVLKCSHTK